MDEITIQQEQAQTAKEKRTQKKQQPKERIEKRVADTLLEQRISVRVGAKRYDVAQPTIATLVMVSEAITRMPRYTLDGEKAIQECLFIGKYSGILAEILAILILGAKRICRSQKSGRLSRFFGFFRGGEELSRMTREIAEEMSPSDLFGAFSRILSTMELQDFFAITTFLYGINLLHPTEKVENGTN